MSGVGQGAKRVTSATRTPDDLILVPVKTMLRRAAYRKLAAFAAEQETTVAVVVQHLVEKACNVEPPAVRKQHRRLTPAQLVQFVRLFESGLAVTKIARRLDISDDSAQRYFKRLFPGGRP